MTHAHVDLAIRSKWIAGRCALLALLAWVAYAPNGRAQVYRPYIDQNGYVHSGRWPGSPPVRVVDRADLELDPASNRVFWVERKYRDPGGIPTWTPAPEFLHPARNPYFDEMRGVLAELHTRLEELDLWAQRRLFELNVQNQGLNQWAANAANNKNALPFVIVMDAIGKGNLNAQAQQVHIQYEQARQQLIAGFNGRFDNLARQLIGQNHIPYTEPMRLPDMVGAAPVEARPRPSTNPETYSRRWGMHYERLAQNDGTFQARLTRQPVQGGGAAVLGLEPGDIVVALDSMTFRTPEDVDAHIDITDVDFINVRTGRLERRQVNLGH